MKTLITALSAATLAMFAASAAQAGTYPERPIRLIAPYAAGGLTDILARSLAQEMSKRLGQSVIVENKAGAGGVIGTDYVAKSAADGYTIVLVGQGIASVNPSLYPNLPYNTLSDFAPISLVSKFSLVLVNHPEQPRKSAKDIIDAARANPGELSYGSAGNASTAHLTMAMLNDETGTQMLHVPFRGESAAFTELMGGRIDTLFATVGGALPFIESGKLRALAVADKERSALMPDVPTLAEQGVENFDSFGWYALLAPAQVPQDILMRLNKEVVSITQDPEFKQQMLARGIDTVGSSPQELGQTIADETERWSRIIQKTGIRVD